MGLADRVGEGVSVEHVHEIHGYIGADPVVIAELR